MTCYVTASWTIFEPHYSREQPIRTLLLIISMCCMAKNFPQIIFEVWHFHLMQHNESTMQHKGNNIGNKILSATILTTWSILTVCGEEWITHFCFWCIVLLDILLFLAWMSCNTTRYGFFFWGGWSAHKAFTSQNVIVTRVTWSMRWDCVGIRDLQVSSFHIF